MLREVLYRSGMLVLLLWLVSFAVFLMTSLIPGDPVYTLLGDNATPAQAEALRESLGLNQPILVRYLDWFAGVLRGDLGVSLFSSQSVSDAIMSRIGVSISLVGLALIVSVVVGTVIGVLAAIRPGSIFDRVALFLSSVGIAMPNFWLGLLLIGFVGSWTNWLPTGGYSKFSDGFADWFLHLLLPVLTLAAGGIAEIARQTRASVMDTHGLDFVTTLNAKGLPQGSVLVKHVLRTAMIPVVTVAGLQVNRLFGLSVLVEMIFQLPGIGSLMVNAVFSRDITMVQGTVLLATAVVVVANLLVDLSYRWFNPKGAQ